MDINKFESRKLEHIQHSLELAHQAEGLSGFDQIHLVHDALPELDLNEVSLETNCFGTQLHTPFYVAGMTAGHARAPVLNRILAVACAERGWAMGVGSQRRDLEYDATGSGLTSLLSGGPSIDLWHALRDEVPQLVLFANIGLSQLIRAPFEKIVQLIDVLKAQALVVHVNALQEALQVEGTPQFVGGLDTLKRYCQELNRPVILKETGCGFSQTVLQRISSLGLAAVDVSGLGGTHWGRIEGARAPRESVLSRAAVTFANWGESTVDSVLSAQKILTGPTQIWGSGGVRSGLDAAKLIALGAHRVGYAQPALRAAMQGEEALRLWMETQEMELRIALFCTGSKTCQLLREREGLWQRLRT